MSVDRLQLNAYMRRACSGDCQAFGALAADVQDELYRLALAGGLQQADAGEAVQETLLRAFAGRQGWRQGSDVMAWLCGFVVNICRERYRDRRRRLALPLEKCHASHVLQGTAASVPWEPEHLQQLKKAIAKLPPRQRRGDRLPLPAADDYPRGGRGHGVCRRDGEVGRVGRDRATQGNPAGGDMMTDDADYEAGDEPGSLLEGLEQLALELDRQRYPGTAWSPAPVSHPRPAGRRFLTAGRIMVGIAAAAGIGFAAILLGLAPSRPSRRPPPLLPRPPPLCRSRTDCPCRSKIESRSAWPLLEARRCPTSRQFSATSLPMPIARKSLS